MDNGRTQQGRKANGRRKRAYAAKLPHGVLFAGRASCADHKIHGIIEKATSEAETIGDVHAIAFTTGVPRRRNTIFDSLLAIVAEELVVLDHDHPLWIQQREDILKHTLGRAWRFVRGSRVAGDTITAVALGLQDPI